MTDIEKLVRKNILALEPYSSARDEFEGDASVFLDANENPFGTLNRYPDPHQKKLKEKISQLKNISVRNLFLGNGSDEVIDLLFRVFCNPGIDKALTFTPTYGMYKVSAAINDVELSEIPLLPENFQINENGLDSLLKIENLKLIFLCSPNNPTGNNIAKLDFILEHFKGITVIDEAYIDFSNKPSYKEKLALHPRLVILQTLSKAWGLAGARVGMCFANEGIIDLLKKVKPPYNISQPNQDAALKALDKHAEFLEHVNVILQERKRVAVQLLTKNIVQRIFQSDGNFLLVKVQNARQLYNYLLEQGIVVRNRHSVVENSIRITIGTVEENDKMLAAVKTFAERFM